MRSGRSRSDERTRFGERGNAIPGAQRDQVRRLALQLARILDQNDAFGGLCHLGEERVDEGRLAGRGSPGDQNVAPLRNGIPEDFGLLARHDAGGGIIIESEDRDRRLADGKRWRRNDRRDQAFEALSGFRQLGRDPWRRRMHLRSDMVGDEAHDPLTISRGQSLPGVGQALGQAVDPQPAVRVEHDLHNGRIFQPGRDRRPQRRAQHPGAARNRFCRERNRPHHRPVDRDRPMRSNSRGD
jgi:hypothetical protein